MGRGAIVPNFPSGTFTTNANATGATLTPGAWSTVGGASLIQ